MKQLPFKISKDAATDLEDIWCYTVEQADRYYDLIIGEINYICKHTQSGKPMEHVRKGYRASKVKSHLIFYKVANETVAIIRVLHERMDVESRLID